MEEKKSNIFGLDLKVDQDYIAETVKQSVLLGISESLNGKNEVTSQIVNMVMDQHVDENGRPVEKGKYGDKGTLLAYYVKQILTKEMKEQIRNCIKDQEPSIKKAIAKSLASRSTQDSLVEAMIGGLEKNIDYDWRLNVDFNFKKEEEK